MIYDVIIIGGGAAGLGAALYSARYNLKTLIIAKEFGGTGNIAHKVDNWIGEPGISGMDLMDKFIAHVDSYGVEKVEDEIKSIKKNKEIFEVQGKKKYSAKSIIYSLGMVHKELGVEGEKEFAGKGIHYCYTCDGPIYSGKNVIMVGGGDSAGWGSVFLSEHAKSVTTMVRKDKMKAEPITVKQMEDSPKINIKYNTEIKKFYGDKLLEGVILKDGTDMKIDGVFIEIGHLPLNQIAKSCKVKLDKSGFIKVNNHQKTNIKGFCAAGDITTRHTLKQFITSASEGSVAAESIYNFIKNKKW